MPRQMIVTATPYMDHDSRASSCWKAASELAPSIAGEKDGVEQAQTVKRRARGKDVDEGGGDTKQEGVVGRCGAVGSRRGVDS